MNKTENITLVCTFLKYQTAVVSPTWVISDSLLSKDMLAELSGLERVVLLLFIILSILYFYSQKEICFICQCENTQYSTALVFLLGLLVRNRTSEKELGGTWNPEKSGEVKNYENWTLYFRPNKREIWFLYFMKYDIP